VTVIQRPQVIHGIGWLHDVLSWNSEQHLQISLGKDIGDH
jgi:hypothetical protein